MIEQPARYFEDFPVGTTFETATYAVTLEAIREFARVYDPQPFHLDPEAAKDSIFRKLVASGWHTAAVTMKLLVESGVHRAGGLVGLGVDELRWPNPVVPGDVLRVRTEAVEATPSRSGKSGIIRWRTTTLNQRDEIVLSMTSIALAPGRPR